MYVLCHTRCMQALLPICTCHNAAHVGGLVAAHAQQLIGTLSPTFSHLQNSVLWLARARLHCPEVMTLSVRMLWDTGCRHTLLCLCHTCDVLGKRQVCAVAYHALCLPSGFSLLLLQHVEGALLFSLPGAGC